MQQDAQIRNNLNISSFLQISMKDLYAFLAIIVQMDRNCKHSIKLYCTNDELYHAPFYSSMISHDCFLKDLK
jgi:hypothetical protein